MTHAPHPIPQSGTPCNVRNRLAVIQQVENWEDGENILSMVRVKYLDRGLPEAETLLWNVEPQTALLPHDMLPACPPTMVTVPELRARIQAQKITAVRDYLQKLEPNLSPEIILTAPAHCAFHPEEYQLLPLVKAMEMPIVNLMIADEMGMGKNLEAGLIAQELLVRKRARKIIVLCPKQLQEQWKREMREKFALDFTIVDHDENGKFKQSMGLDKNPWRHHDLVITAAQYLEQPLSLEQFLAAVSQEGQNRTKPWDLLILDEAHKMAPQPDQNETETTRMLRHVASLCKHKIFLTASPQEGNVSAFTGLLEILDPTRFRQANHMTEAERKRLPQLVIRRRKTDVQTHAMAPRNAPVPILLDHVLNGTEHPAMKVEHAFQTLLHDLRAKPQPHPQTRDFVLETLSRWYTSSILTLQAFWTPLMHAFENQEPGDELDLIHLKNSLEQEQNNDLEAQQWNHLAATQIGAWLAREHQNLASRVVELNRLLSHITPQEEPKILATRQLIRDKLRQQDNWKDGEKLVIFTAFKQTQDLVAQSLLPEDTPRETRRINLIYGGMPPEQREQAQRQFNDPKHPGRILIVTDAAAEGLNLQEQARFILHLDCPWNPMRVEQRNGRLDRHGQTRHVTPYYFDAKIFPQLKALATMMRWTEQYRHNLGAVAQLISDSTRKAIILNQSPDPRVTARIEQEGKAVNFQADSRTAPECHLHSIMPPELDQDELINLLEQAMGQPLMTVDQDQTFTLPQNLSEDWIQIARESLKPTPPYQNPRIAFNLKPASHSQGTAHQRQDMNMLHLAHPLLRKAANSILGKHVRRQHATLPWTIQPASMPQNCQAIITLYVHETAVNKGQEIIHDVVRELTFKLQNGILFQIKRTNADPAEEQSTEQDIKCAQKLLEETREKLQERLRKHRRKLKNAIRKRLDNTAGQISEREHQRLQSREGELSPLMHQRTVNRKLRDIEALGTRQKQAAQFLFPELAEQENKNLETAIRNMRQDLQEDQTHYDRLRTELECERKEIIETIIPERFTLEGEPQVTVIAMKLLLPRRRKSTP